MSSMTQIMLGHPATGSPNIIALTTTNTIPANARRQNSSPMIDEKTSGTMEKPTIPLIEYLSSERKFHLLFPAARSTFSYEMQWVLNPTQEKMPLEKRLTSLSERTASTNRLVMQRKSRAPSTISVSEILLMIR